MQVTVEEHEPRTKTLNVEIDAGKVAETMKDVYKELGKTAEVPGFRKGKAPMAILERYLSPETVRRHTIDRLVPPAYEQALEEQAITPYAEPRLEVVQFEAEKPFIFKASVPLPPTIELGEYEGIEVERPKVTVTDEDVEEHLKNLQEQHATSEKIEDRGVENDDFVVAEIASQVEGEEEKGEPRRSLLHVGANLPDFDAAIMGMKPGEQRTFTVTYPADFQDEALAGKKADFDVKVEVIRIKKLPELNDEFAKTVAGLDAMDALREDIRKRLTEAREEMADQEVEGKIVEEIVSRSKVEFPEVMTEHEVHHDIHDIEHRLEQQRMTIQEYLQQTGKTEEQFLEELKESANRRIKVGLILGEISDKENIDVTDEDVDAEIQRLAEESQVAVDAVETYLEQRGGKRGLKNSLLNKKLFDFLKSVSDIKVQK